MFDKKAINLLKKYYLPYETDTTPSDDDIDYAVSVGILVPDITITHDEMISEIKDMSRRISVEIAGKAFLYSLSSGDTRYRSAISSLLWARALPEHSTEKATGGMCKVCGCTHGFDLPETIDLNRFGVFRYLAPLQYGNRPDLGRAEYVFNDLREFEKLPPAEPCERDYDILNRIFGAVSGMKPHNKASALITEIRKRGILDITGSGIHCLLGVLSMCGILETDENKGYLHNYTNSSERNLFQDNDLFYPLKYWKGKNGINNDAVNEIFGNFSSDKLMSGKDVTIVDVGTSTFKKKTRSKAERFFTDDVYCVMLTNEERHYLALEDMCSEWERVTAYSVTHLLHKRTVMFFDGNTIVKVIYEEYRIDDRENCTYKDYLEYDTCLETIGRKMLSPLTDRGRPKPVTPTNVMSYASTGCDLYIRLKKGESKIFVKNSRNAQELAIGEHKRIQSIGNDEDFHAFMSYYISTCPSNYFDRINEIKTMEHQTVKFTPGDIFRCRTDRTHYVYGIIIGKTRDIEKWKELPTEHSFRHLMTQPIIVRLYDFITENGEMTVKEFSGKSLGAVQICSDNEIIWGTHKIIGHKQLDPDDIQFQIHLKRQWYKDEHIPPLAQSSQQDPVSMYVEWGFVKFDIPWANIPEDIRAMLAEGEYFNGGVSLGIRLSECGKTLADILAEHPKSTIQYDLLLPENRDKFNAVMAFLGLPDNCTYDDFARKYGGITRQDYIDTIGRIQQKK